MNFLKKYIVLFFFNAPKKEVKKAKRKYTKRIKAQNITKKTVASQNILEKINVVKNDVFDSNKVIQFLRICKKLYSKKYTVYRYTPKFKKNDYNVTVQNNPDFDYSKVENTKNKISYDVSIKKNICKKNTNDYARLKRLSKIAFNNININNMLLGTENDIMNKILVFALSSDFNFYNKRKLFFTDKKTYIHITDNILFLQNNKFKMQLKLDNINSLMYI